MNRRKRSQLQERRTAEELGGRVQKASGATQFAKGDVRVMGDIRLECKTTSAQSFKLELSDILKIQKEAILGGCENWAMQIEFQGPVGLNKKFAVIDWQTFLDIHGQTSN